MAQPSEVRLARHANDLDDDGHDKSSPWRELVKVATTATITIATALNDGDVIDGITLRDRDRVLVKDQSSPVNNGIYVVGTTPARATDFADGSQYPAFLVFVLQGTAGEGTAWRLNPGTSGTVQVGLDDIVFDEFAGSGAFALDDLSDVDTSGVGDGDVLTFDSGTGDWVAETPSGATPSFIGCKVTRGSALSINSATYTPVNFTGEAYDTSAMHDNSTNNTRITVGTTGYWLAEACITFAASALGTERIVEFYLSGSVPLERTHAVFSATADTSVTLSCVFHLTSGDYIECRVYQDTGGALNITNNGFAYPFFSLSLIGV